MDVYIIISMQTMLLFILMWTLTAVNPTVQLTIEVDPVKAKMKQIVGMRHLTVKVLTLH